MQQQSLKNTGTAAGTAALMGVCCRAAGPLLLDRLPKMQNSLESFGCIGCQIYTLCMGSLIACPSSFFFTLPIIVQVETHTHHSLPHKRRGAEIQCGYIQYLAAFNAMHPEITCRSVALDALPSCPSFAGMWTNGVCSTHVHTLHRPLYRDLALRLANASGLCRPLDHSIPNAIMLSRLLLPTCPSIPPVCAAAG